MVAKYDLHRQNPYKKSGKTISEVLMELTSRFTSPLNEAKTHAQNADEWACMWGVLKIPGPICYCMQRPQDGGKGWLS